MQNLDKARQKKKEMLEAGIKLEQLNPIEKAKQNPSSMRLAVNAKCWDCSCEQIKEVRLCTVAECPLFPVRPYQKKAEDKAA